MASFAEKYRKSGTTETVGTSFASQYRKDESGMAPLGSMRDENRIAAEKAKRAEMLRAEAERYADEARKQQEKADRMQSIIDIPKGIYQAGKETLASIGDVALRLSPIEGIRNQYSGISEAINPKYKGSNTYENYQRGIVESQARPTMFEQVTGKSLTKDTGGIDWNVGRQFVGRAMEAPTYAYSATAKASQLAGANILKRVGVRTLTSLPEAGINTGLQSFEEGNVKNAPINFASNVLLMSVLSNVGGEIGKKVKVDEKVAKETADSLSSTIGRDLTPDEETAMLDAFSRGATKEEILSGAGKAKISEGITNPKPSLVEEVANIEAKQGRKLTVDEVKQVSDEMKGVKPVESPVTPPKSKKTVNVPTKAEKAAEATTAPIQEAIKPGTDPLIQEAKKYKSAEEFVKAQGNSLKHGSESNIAEFKPYSVYKGTDETGKVINEINGVYFTNSDSEASKFGKYVNEGIVDKNAKIKKVNLATSDARTAVLMGEDYKKKILAEIKKAKEEGFQGVEIKRSAPTRGTDKEVQQMQKKLDSLRPEYNSAMDKVNEELFKQNVTKENVAGLYEKIESKYPIVAEYRKLQNELNPVHTVVFDKNAIKTKSQLTDIWNKANAETPKITQKVEPKVETTEAPVEPQKQKTSVIASRLNESLPEGFKIDDQYDPKVIKNETDKAATLISENKAEAIRKAIDPNTNAMERDAILIELSEIAKRDGDYSTVADLFQRRSELIRSGAQALNMEKASILLNPHESYMRKVVESRLSKVKINGKSLSEAEMKASRRTIRKEVDETVKKAFKISDAQDLLNAITCK